jgi:hypothetical protein
MLLNSQFLTKTKSKTGVFYTDVLSDIDKLVATDTAFLLGPFLESARRLGRPQNDCFSNILEDSDCGHFYEWNARTQITTWNPTRKDSDVIPGGPIDYASKHWSGLIRDYYVPRATLLMKQAIKDRTAGRSLIKQKFHVSMLNLPTSGQLTRKSTQFCQMVMLFLSLEACTKSTHLSLSNVKRSAGTTLLNLLC